MKLPLSNVLELVAQQPAVHEDIRMHDDGAAQRYRGGAATHAGEPAAERGDPPADADADVVGDAAVGGDGGGLGSEKAAEHGGT